MAREIDGCPDRKEVEMENGRPRRVYSTCVECRSKLTNHRVNGEPVCVECQA